MSEDTQIRRYGVFFTELSHDICFVYVDDLVNWIEHHIREGNIDSIYTDLLTALDEKGE